VLCAILLAGPGQTVTTTYLDQLVTHLDSAYRIAAGQVPNRDFHSAVGPLASYLPWAGYLLSGALGAAMPVGMGLAVLALTPVIAYVLISRLHPIIALSLGAFLILVLAVPVNLGEAITALSFAKFYNRIGWAALATVLVMYLAPRSGAARQSLPDALAASFLTLVMLYTKATYGLVALAFVAAMVLHPGHRRWAACALGLVAALALIVEVFWRSSLAYAADLWIALQVSGALRGSWGQITDHVLGNLADYTLLALLVGFALRRTRSWRDALFYAFCAVAGFLVINQNFQAWGILTLHAAAAVAAESILRKGGGPAGSALRRDWSVQAGAALVFVSSVLPTIIHCAVALGLHAGIAVSRSGEGLSLPNLERVSLVDLWSPSEHAVARTYLTSVEDGIGTLSGLGQKPDRIVVLGVANPFTATLGAAPARGDSPSLLWGRNINDRHFVPAEELLGDARIVMAPRTAEEGSTARTPAAMQSETPEHLYGPYLATHFELLSVTDHWAVYRRRNPGQAGCGAACSSGADQAAAWRKVLW
jgi:hypothetical protein